MRATGPGEWWRRCCWWREADEDGEENGWSIMLHRCGRCGVEETLMAEACETIADARAEAERAHPEDENARVCGICTYCGEVIKKGSTVPMPFNTLFKEFDSLTYCRGVWWMRAHGGDVWRRCYSWNVDDAARQVSKDGETIVELKRCHRCGEESKFLDDTLGHMSLALMS